MVFERIVLWDIDHTLMDTRGVGRELSAQAFRRATGLEMREQAKIDGITEPVIFRETAKLHGLVTGRSDFERFAEALADAHIAHAAELRARGHALAGAATLLDRLADVPGVVQTVVSGNIRPVSEIKLATFGLDQHIVWEIGAYGDDADERPDLVRIAMRRATEHFGRTVSPADIVLLGDTPADVQAALAVNVPVIAVATGRSTEQDLRNAGASRVLPDLTDTEKTVEWITSAPRA
ncbi:HAD family hydrolase [Streptomyces sp. CBMA29]|uniref:HAD family hydrolase n=1 Tax=Streptomyces sp. CBMA29 TaxID=1896314 RepID=UPI001661E1DE|nr:haloacid dehalogenase-like hydrolase [Streptomyces sp. CBMA29]MBD0737810.1 phosphoglycolate phosphatase [Streptomyces sp. CBMA29]